MKRIIFIINGSKKQNKKLNSILEFFASSSFFSKVEVKLTKCPGHATLIANESVSKFDYMVVVGGDGTLNEVLNGIDLTSKIILGLLPYGTANDFSRGQKLQFDAQFLFNLICNDCYKNIDIGLVTGLDKATSINRRFINIADIGIGGFVTQKIAEDKYKWLSGKIKYAQAILMGMVQFVKPELVVEGDYHFQGKVLTLAVCNGAYFGYGLCISPMASVQNRSLNITCIGNVSLMDYLKNLRTLKSGKIINHPEVHYKIIKSIVVCHKNNPCPIEVDGEFIGYTPVTIQILPQQLRFLLP